MIINASVQTKVEAIHRRIKYDPLARSDGRDSWELCGVTVRTMDEGYSHGVSTDNVKVVAGESMVFSEEDKRFVPGARFFKGDVTAINNLLYELGIAAQ